MLDQLIIILRAAQLYTHNAHNLIVGATFFEDHEFLGDLYPKYESTYDSVVERMIGLGNTPDLVETQIGAAQVMTKIPSSSEAFTCFSGILKFEELICSKAQECVLKGSYSEGTRQMLGNICDESEARQYKLKQRMKTGVSRG